MIDPAKLEVDVREYLADPHIRTKERSTNEVLTYLFEEGGPTMTQLFRALDKMADFELADCCKRGEPIVKRMFGKLKTVTPIMWSAGIGGERKVRLRKNAITCPHCKKPISLDQ